MSTNNKVLKGGLDSGNGTGTTGTFSEVAKKRQQGVLDKARRLSFLDLNEDELPEIAEEEDDLEQQLIDLIDEYADEAYKWVLVQLAKKHEYEYKIAESGDDYGRKKVKNGLELRQALAKFDEKLTRVLQFCPDDRKECREFHDAEFAEIVCHRVRVMARLAVLVNALLFAESKDAFEKVVQDAKENDEPVFTTKPDGEIRGFHDGPRYYLNPAAFSGYKDVVFTGYHKFAFDQLSSAIGERASELSKAHREEKQDLLKKQREGDESRIDAEGLLFGGAEETNEKTALLSWQYNRYENTIVIRRRDKALIVESVTGASEKDFRELSELNAEYGVKSVMVMLYNIVDGDKLVARQEDDKYRFNINVPGNIVVPNDDKEETKTKKERKRWWNLALKMTLWVRTAAGASVPREMIPDDEVVEPVRNGNGHSNCNGFKLAIPLVDNDGKELVEPEVFWFRKINGGAGTVVIPCPKGFVLRLPEGYDQERREPISPERDIVFVQETTKIRVRRAIVKGGSNIAVDDCDDPGVREEFRVSGLIENEVPEGNWLKMGLPWSKLMPYGYKQAVLTGQINPRKKD